MKTPWHRYLLPGLAILLALRPSALAQVLRVVRA